MQAMTRLDHLVLVVPELEPAMERIRGEWGCDVLAGGRHPDWGSWNALVPLSGEAYLEVIAPHPDPPRLGRRAFGLDDVGRPSLRTWAVRPDPGTAPELPERSTEEGIAERSPPDLEGLGAAVRSVGVDPGRLLPGSRRTRDGVLLEWRLGDPFADRLSGTVPFLIDRGDTPHLSAAGAATVILAGLQLGHPEALPVRTALEALGAADLAAVTTAPAPAMRARLRTPRGEVEVTGLRGEGREP
jgi:hypothetical protein